MVVNQANAKLSFYIVRFSESGAKEHDCNLNIYFLLPSVFWENIAYMVAKWSRNDKVIAIT